MRNGKDRHLVRTSQAGERHKLGNTKVFRWFLQHLDGTSHRTLHTILSTFSQIKSAEIRAGAEKDLKLDRKIGR